MCNWLSTAILYIFFIFIFYIISTAIFVDRSYNYYFSYSVDKLYRNRSYNKNDTKQLFNIQVFIRVIFYN